MPCRFYDTRCELAYNYSCTNLVVNKSHCKASQFNSFIISKNKSYINVQNIWWRKRPFPGNSPVSNVLQHAQQSICYAFTLWARCLFHFYLLSLNVKLFFHAFCQFTQCIFIDQKQPRYVTGSRENICIDHVMCGVCLCLCDNPDFILLFSSDLFCLSSTVADVSPPVWVHFLSIDFVCNCSVSLNTPYRFTF